MVNKNPFSGYLGSVGEDHHKLVADSSLNYGIGFVKDVKIITVTDDQVIDTQTTLQDVIDLLLTLKPNTRYYIEVRARMISAADADIDLAFADITGTGYDGYKIGTLVDNFVDFGTATEQATDGSIEYVTVIAFVKTGSAGGILQFQFAQGTSQSSDTKILEGTVMLVYEL